MDNNTQKTEVALNGQEQLLDQQLDLLYKRAKGKWSWISIVSTLILCVLIIYTALVVIVSYKIWDSVAIVFRLATTEITCVIISFGLDSILIGLRNHLVVVECANLLKSKKVVYRAWLRARNMEMRQTNQGKNLQLIGKDEEVFYAIRRLETGLTNACLIKRELLECLGSIILGVAFYFSVDFIGVSFGSVVALTCSALSIWCLLLLFANLTYKNSQRRNMVAWVNMTATKLENEDLKGYDKDLYLNQQ